MLPHTQPGKTSIPKAFHQSGFTIMELAIVLVIVALLLGGLLLPLSSQQDLQGRQATEKALTDIREALIGFAVINGRLPCPAQADIAYTAANAGLEATTGSGATLSCACVAASSPGVAQIGATPCSVSAATDTVGGVLPWASLGLLETDAMGNRYTYHVNTFFARGVGQTTFGCTPSTTPANAAFAICTPGSIGIYTAANKTIALASQVPAIVVSHGKSALGAYTPQGTQLTPATAGSDQAENSNGDASFVSNTFIDDQLAWLPLGILMNRLIGAAKLP